MKRIFELHVDFAWRWFSTMMWHFWYIIALRPQFMRLSDSSFTLTSFLVVYIAGGVARWCLANGQSLPSTLFGMVIYVIFMASIATRKGSATALFSVFLAVSSMIDFSVSFLYFFGIMDAVETTFPLLLFENGALIFFAYLFFREREAIKKKHINERSR